MPYGGRRSSFEVHWLKDQVRRRRQLDDLSTHQAQLLVVIQHRVHVLDPHRVHRTVEDQPLPVRRLCTERLPLAMSDVDGKPFACSKSESHRLNHALPLFFFVCFHAAD